MSKIKLTDVLQDAVDLIFDNIKNIGLIAGGGFALFLGMTLLMRMHLGMMSISIAVIAGIATLLIAGFLYLILLHQLTLAAQGKSVSVGASLKAAMECFLRYVGLLLLLVGVAILVGMGVNLVFLFLPSNIIFNLLADLAASCIVSYFLFLTVAILMFDTKSVFQAFSMNHQWMRQHVNIEIYLVAFAVVSIPVVLKDLLGHNLIFGLADILSLLIYLSIAVTTYTKIKQRQK